MKYIQTMVLFVVIVANINAQKLVRKGSLGVQFHVIEEEKGIYVDKVFPNTTAGNMQIEDEDIILSIDGNAVNTQSDLLNIISTWREGNNLEIYVDRKSQLKIFKGQVVAKPKEKPRVGTIEYLSVKYRDGQLRVLLNKPEDVTNPPCVFLIPGFGCTSIDYYYRTSVIRLLVEGLVEKGFAVFRMEKPGMGDSNNSEACNEIGYKDELEAYSSSLTALKSRSDIDVNNIFLFGGSTGGITATAVGASNHVRGIIKWGSLFLPIHDHRLSRLDQESDDFEIRKRVYMEYFIDKKHPEEMAKNDVLDKIMRSDDLLQWDGKYILRRDPSFMVEINDVVTEDSIKKAKCPMLAIHGEFDLNIGNSDWAMETARAVNSVLPGQGKYIILKQTNHGYTKVPSEEENLRLTASQGFTNEYRESNFNYDIVEVVAQWISEKLI